jgi:hypothetical protein
MKLNSAGQMVEREWNRIPHRYRGVYIDRYVIMPNHFHGIIKIVGTPLVGVRSHSDRGEIEINQKRMGTSPVQPKRMGTSPIPTLFDVIGTFKSITTNKYIIGVKQNNWPPFYKRIWQLRYYDRIIRNEIELEKIKEIYR